MSDEPALRLPGHLGELVRRGHTGAALRLIQEWGGRAVYIPENPSPDSPIAQIAGLAAAKVLAELGGGVNYDIPSKAWLKGDSLKDEILRSDGSTREVAERLECTERHVRGVRSGQRIKPADDRQKSMFD